MLGEATAADSATLPCETQVGLVEHPVVLEDTSISQLPSALRCILACALAPNDTPAMENGDEEVTTMSEPEFAVRITRIGPLATLANCVFE